MSTSTSNLAPALEDAVGEAICPLCKSKDLGWFRPVYHPKHITIDTYCSGCGASWIAEYTFTDTLSLCDADGQPVESTE